MLDFFTTRPFLIIKFTCIYSKRKSYIKICSKKIWNTASDFKIWLNKVVLMVTERICLMKNINTIGIFKTSGKLEFHFEFLRM